MIELVICLHIYFLLKGLYRKKKVRGQIGEEEEKVLPLMYSAKLFDGKQRKKQKEEIYQTLDEPTHAL